MEGGRGEGWGGGRERDREREARVGSTLAFMAALLSVLTTRMEGSALAIVSAGCPGPASQQRPFYYGFIAAQRAVSRQVPEKQRGAAPRSEGATEDARLMDRERGRGR